MDKWPENYLNEENKSMKNKHIKKMLHISYHYYYYY